MSGQFIDKVRIFVKGGDGGAGCMSFRREAHVPRGGPDGGDGGRGGNVVLVADASKSSLIEFRYMHHFKASRGTHGKGAKMHGVDGKDIFLKVPVGTIVRELYVKDEDGLNSQLAKAARAGKVVCDFTKNGQEFVIARGGSGGRGNIHFVTPQRRAPEFAELGEPVEGKWIELEMKLLADAALVGMPSSGKSSLISRLSAAKPKVADYPFTTLTPNLGVAKAGEYNYVLADVPGLIEGAHLGRGLGHEFLRHIERSAIIVHIVDLSGGWENRDPVEDFNTIINELAAYDAQLTKRAQIVVANKIDIVQSDTPRKKLQDALLQICSDDKFKCKWPFLDPHLYCVSAATGHGLKKLNLQIAQKVKNIKVRAFNKYEDEDKYEKIWTLRKKSVDNTFKIKKLCSNKFEVIGDKPKRAVIQTDLENEEAVIYLQHRLRKMGVDNELEKAGAKDGDEIIIANRSFDFQG